MKQLNHRERPRMFCKATQPVLEVGFVPRPLIPSLCSYSL